MYFGYILDELFGNDVNLNEATFPIDDDVDFLWNNYMSKVVGYYRDNPEEIYKNVAKDNDIEIYDIASSALPSEVSNKADKKELIRIKIGVFKRGNVYDIKQKQIFLSLNKRYIVELGNKGLNDLDKFDIIHHKQIKSVFSDILKSSIAHELSHWLNNSLHNRNMEQLSSLMIKKYKTSNELFPYIEFSNMSWPEIDANIHAMVELKRNFTQEEWNKLTFIDLFNLKTSYIHMINNIKTLSKEKQTFFMRAFISRMTRESLLGKNMRENFFG